MGEDPVDSDCIKSVGLVKEGSCRETTSSGHGDDKILETKATETADTKNDEKQGAAEGPEGAVEEVSSPAARRRPQGFFGQVLFVIVTILTIVGYIFMFLGLTVVFMAVGLVAASVACLLPCLVFPAICRTRQEGYYVEPNSQQQQLQQQIVDALKPDNRQTLTEEQVNQRFPAITYQRAKIEKDKILASEINAAAIEEGQRECVDDVVTFDPADRDDICAICMEDMENKDPTRILGCSHIFHAECIDTWLIVRRACCPLCKADQMNAQSKISENEPSQLKDLWNKIPLPSSVKLRRRRRNHRNPGVASRRRGNALRNILERNRQTQSQSST